MSLVEELLPALKGIKEEQILRTNVVILAGQYHQWVAEYDGWLESVSAILNQRYTRMSHDIWTAPVEYTPYLINLYAVPPNSPSLAYNTLYDPVNNLFGTVYIPRPYKAFKKGRYIRLTAPTVDPLTGLPIVTPTLAAVFTVHMIYITNEEEFMVSLRTINGATEPRRILS